MQVDVVDPRLAAGRGDEFRASTQRARADELADLAAADGGDFRLPLNRWYDENVDLEETECASLEVAIPQSNVGYRLLQRLGWRPGGGLGREQQGICEPIRLDANDTGTRIGLGRRQQERQYTAAELVERRPLEAELQAEEDEGRKAKREMEAERQSKIREEVKHELRMFFCQICHKQYQFAHEMEEHLSSYDHHHRKRLAETRVMLSERGKKDREKRERRRAEKEAERMAAQVKAAQAAAGMEEPPPLPPEDGGAPPPPPTEPDGSGDAEAAGGWGTAGGGWESAEADQQPGGWASAGGWQQQGDGGGESGGWGSPAELVPPPPQPQQPQQQPKSLFVSGGVQVGTMGLQPGLPLPPHQPPQQGAQTQQPHQQQQQQQQPPDAYDPFAAVGGGDGGGGGALAARAQTAGAPQLPGMPPPAPPPGSSCLPPPPLPPQSRGAAAAAAAAAAGGPPLPPAAAPQQPRPPAAPPQAAPRVALSLGSGGGKPKQLGGFALAGGKARGKPVAAAAKRAALFGSDSDEEGG